MAKIIAELGINHNGDFELLKKMTLEATESGADYVKIQKRTISWCYTPEELAQPCVSPWGDIVKDKVEGRELSYSQIKEFSEFCKEHKIKWGFSCFDRKSFMIMHSRFKHNIDFYKIPSAMAIMERRSYLEQVARTKQFTIISLGLCKDKVEIAQIATIFEDCKCPYILNHCVAKYPCPLNRLNLGQIKWLESFQESRFYMEGVGYSGHEVGVLPAVIAASMGAIIIERHFTLDRSMYGADQASSLEPQGFAKMVRDVRSLPLIMGNLKQRLLGDEKNPIKFFRDEDPE